MEGEKGERESGQSIKGELYFDCQQGGITRTLHSLSGGSGKCSCDTAKSLPSPLPRQLKITSSQLGDDSRSNKNPDPENSNPCKT